MRRIGAVIFAVISFASWFSHEWIKEVFWERVLHVLSPENELLLQYGPPTVFAGVVLYLLLKDKERSSREMLAVSMMIGGAAVLIWGVLLYRGETGQFPFSEAEKEKPAEAPVPGKNSEHIANKQTASAFVYCDTTSWDVAEKAKSSDDVSIAVATFSLKEPTLITGSTPILKVNHNKSNSSNAPLLCSLTFYTDTPIFNIEIGLSVNVYEIIIEENRMSAGILMHSLPAIVKFGRIDKTSFSFSVYVYSFDTYGAIDLPYPTNFSYSLADGTRATGNIIASNRMSIRSTFPDFPQGPNNH